MPFLAKNEGPVFKLPPEDTYSAICTGVWDLGLQKNQFGASKHRVWIEWEIDLQKEDGSPYRIGQNYALSLYELAPFRKLLEAWYGTKITPEQEKIGFDPRKLLGRPCQLQVIHKPGTGKNASKTYANVGAVMKMGKGMVAYKPTAAPVSFSFDDDGKNIPPETPKYVAQLIQTSVNWLATIPAGEQEPNFAPDDAVGESDIPF